MSNPAVTEPHAGPAGRTFREQVRQLRTDRKLTQAELGRRVGVGQTTVSEWEQGRSYPARRHMLPLANALQVHIGTLFPEYAS